MTAVFPGTGWLDCLERTCLFGLHSTVSRDGEKERLPSLLQRPLLGNGVTSETCLSWDNPGLSLFCHRNHHYYKSISLDPKGSGSHNKHQGSAQLHLLSWAFVVSDSAGDQPSSGTPGLHF